jgi:pimeloyl-ACP methyl ester carboxylesterase
MSTPPFLDLPDGVRAERLLTARGPLATLRADGGGEGGAGSPVLLVPGFTGSKEDFIAVLAPIAAAGHPVVAYDQRGQFESPGPDDPTAYDVSTLADDLLEVVAATGRPVHLVGHSFGGHVSRAAAIADPAAVRSVTLLDSGPSAIPHPSAANLALLAQVLPGMDLPTIWVAKRQLEAPNELTPPPPDIEEWMRGRFIANSPVCLKRIAEQLLEDVDRTAELAAVDVPMLVAFGETDDAWLPATQSAMAALLGAATAVIAGAGHSPAADRPEATAAALLEFWAKVDAG